jgi:DNA polymerase-3 subunit beta
MEFIISKSALQKELGFVQGIVERKNTIPILFQHPDRIRGREHDQVYWDGSGRHATMRNTAEIKVPGSMCVGARKLFDIARMLPDAPVKFRKDENNWASVTCERSNFRIVGVERGDFPEVPSFKTASVKLPAEVFKTFIDRTIFAITLEESRYTLSGAKFMLGKSGARMVTTDGHRLAFVERNDLGETTVKEELDVLIPRKTLAELTKLMSASEGDIGLGADENHIYFEVGSRLLISRTLAGQFPNYEM